MRQANEGVKAVQMLAAQTMTFATMEQDKFANYSDKLFISNNMSFEFVLVNE